MSTSPLLASTITTTFGLVGLAFVASQKEYQVLAAFLVAVVWCLSPLTICFGAGHKGKDFQNNNW